ncbi:SixA phosphatase family protein [Candidatus Enterovibrio escicola]|uniref:SixA phosphatase family protein n=1 Tax=Candidatus Enterovibrio escicola TaxID=1927127 RepID=UPI0037439ABD
MAKLLSEQLPNEHLDVVLVSPYLCAQQTWNACEKELPQATTVMIDNCITPYGKSDQVSTYLRALVSVKKKTSILVISHLPLVGYLIEELVLGLQLTTFPTSSIVCINYDSDTKKSSLLWLKIPLKVQESS